jgi:hypothetical protein
MNDQPREKHLNLRLPVELHAALVAMTRREHRSLNGQIVYLLQRAALAHARQPHEREPQRRG